MPSDQVRRTGNGNTTRQLTILPLSRSTTPEPQEGLNTTNFSSGSKSNYTLCFRPFFYVALRRYFSRLRNRLGWKIKMGLPPNSRMRCREDVDKGDSTMDLLRLCQYSAKPAIVLIRSMVLLSTGSCF